MTTPISDSPNPPADPAVDIEPVAPDIWVSHPPADRSRGRRRGLLVALVVALAVVTAGGVGLIRYLGRHPVVVVDSGKGAPVENSASQAQDARTAPAVPPPTPSPGVGSDQPAAPAPSTPRPGGGAQSPTPASRAAADEHLAAFVAAKAKLDAVGAAEWAADEYAAVIALGAEADALMVAREYPAAAARYTDAAAAAAALGNRAGEMLRELLAAAQAALASESVAIARRKFQQALKIDPGNATAARGLEKADQLAAVARRIAAGTAHEQAGRLSLALAEYQAAAKLMPASDRARRLSEAAERRIADEAFQTHMSAGLTAFHAQDYPRARRELAAARALRPHVPDVAATLAQVEAAERLERITALHARAREAEDAEMFVQALARYQEVLAIDPALAFALEGQARCREIVELQAALDAYLADPGRLESESHQERALVLLEAAGRPGMDHRRLTAAARQLEGLVQTAQTPVPLVLKSDAQTDVAVYHVGRLGRFNTKTLNLRPGTYTMVGTRTGYKDVRRKFRVAPDQAPLEFSIRCTEKIDDQAS